MRERLSYLIVIGIFVLLVFFVFAVLGKGKYQPPPVEDQEKASVSQILL